MEYVDVCVLHDGKIVDNELPNDNVWVEGATLQIDKECYNVELNVPSVTSVKLPEVIISGFPCFPKLKVEFIDLNCCELTWYRELLEKETVSGKEKGGKKREISWERVHSGHTYVPSNDDIGRRYVTGNYILNNYFSKSNIYWQHLLTMHSETLKVFVTCCVKKLSPRT